MKKTYASLNAEQNSHLDFAMPTDIIYESMVQFVRHHLRPEDVFDRSTLMNWAEQHEAQVLQELAKRRVAAERVF